MKNKLAENFLRFAPKNLNESTRSKLEYLAEQDSNDKKAGINILKKLSNISIDIQRTNPKVNASTPLAKSGTDWVSCLLGNSVTREPGTFWNTEEPSPKFGTDLNGVTGNCRIVLDRWGKNTYYVIGTEVSGTVANPTSTGKTVIYKFNLAAADATNVGYERSDIKGAVYPGASFASTFGNIQKTFFPTPQDLKDGSREFKAIMDSLIHLGVISLPKQDSEITQAFPHWNDRSRSIVWIRDYRAESGKESGFFGGDAYTIYLNLKKANLV